MIIRLIGLRNSLGVGIHFSNFVNTLKLFSGLGSRVQEIDCTDQQAMWQAAQNSKPGDINICFNSIDLSNHFRGTNIQWIVFESTRVPPIVMDTMLKADLVWVPSEWGKQTIVGCGLDPNKVDVVPEGVDPTIYHPWHFKQTNQRTKFLSVGKFEERKSQIETLIAWAKVFNSCDDVELVVKTGYFGNTEVKVQQLQKLVTQLELHNVKIIWGNVDDDSLLHLYAGADIFVLPTRGEGWGLPIIEAAAIGLPIITTMYSGHTQYLKHIASSVVPVQYDLEPIACPEFQMYYPNEDGNWGHWARPRLDSLANALVHAFRNRDQLCLQAKKNSSIIRNKFSWTASVDCAVAVLQHRELLS
jgi:glycosyltransferase involved in cell wall biosynthesis